MSFPPNELRRIASHSFKGLSTTFLCFSGACLFSNSDKTLIYFKLVSTSTVKDLDTFRTDQRFWSRKITVLPEYTNFFYFGIFNKHVFMEKIHMIKIKLYLLETCIPAYSLDDI